MKCKFAILPCTLFLLCSLMGLLASCAQDGDGALPVMPNGESVEGKGYFLGATLDSGKVIHLDSDTLYLTLSKIWSFSDCSLKSIDLGKRYEGSDLIFSPVVNIKVNTDDCPAPLYRTDTTFKLVLDDVPAEVSKVLVRNDTDSLMDTIMYRRGELQKDSFWIYVDTAFGNTYSLPLRTKESPSFLRVLDSLTPRTFYWRTLRSNCTMRVDMCDSVVADTLFPSSWNVDDTVLVPVRRACALGDSVYCLSSKWENDSSAVGKVNVRPDTIWHTSLYYVEEIPECGTVSYYTYSGFVLGSKTLLVRELFKPDESELSCGPSSKKDWIAYNLSTGRIVVDDEENGISVDSLYKIWKSATVAADTLVADTTESK